MMNDVMAGDKRFDPCRVPWPNSLPIVEGADRLRAYRIIRDLQSPKADWPTIQARLNGLSETVVEAAAASGRDIVLLSALMATESEGDPLADSGSAGGLMQITRLTWEHMRQKHAGFTDTVYERDRYDPRINLFMGAAILTDMSERIARETGVPEIPDALLCMAYNVGPGVVTRYLRHPQASHQAGSLLRELALDLLNEAIRETGTHIYYTVCNGARVNPHVDGKTVSDKADRFAVLLKTAEVYYFLERIENFRRALSKTR